ncbi:olfactory receptor 4K5-like, partial [Amia ocellicauda]|uniref:olfactory receptor 4K5-like n=1 Tax=Amia ocellicauda TaxID=2972642 RepID=UPI0034642092
MENSSVVEVFTLQGLNETKANTFIFFAIALLAYLLIFFFNMTLIITIITEKTLYEPMYIFLCNLCVNGLYGTAGLYPKLLADFLSGSHVISYAGCHLQVFVIYTSVQCEFTILTVMAYDRYVAICKPLQYHSIMTSLTISKFLLVSWLLPFCEHSVSTWLSVQLPLCGSHIDKLYCENWSIPVRNFLAVEFLLIPPLLNPLIYGLKLKDI